METFDYIVVGSGIAGLHSAYRLQQNGCKVLVLEKEGNIGGRMSTKNFDGQPVDYGAKFVSTFYKNIFSLAEELELKPVPTQLTKLGIKRNGKIYNFDASKLFPLIFYKGISFRAKIRLSFALLIKLFQSRKLDFYRLQDALYLDNKSVYEDFKLLAGEEGFENILEAICENIFFYGSKEFSRAPFLAIFSKFFKFKTASFSGGINQLCRKMAKNLQVELNSEVISVERTGSAVKVIANRENQENVYEAKKIIMAIPGDLVLKLLKTPTEEEKIFFPQVKYSKTVQILCSTQKDFFGNLNVIWTIPKEASNFSSLVVSPYIKSSNGATYFIAALRESAYKKIEHEKNLNTDYLKLVIEREFAVLADVRVLGTQIWESAVPKFYPGYLTKLISFLHGTFGDDNIYYCGDYLENPSTEGALTSSIKMLKKLRA